MSFAASSPSLPVRTKGTLPIDVSVSRFHGLGNVFCLLPVLDRLRALGQAVHVATRPEWLPVFQTIRPQFHWDSQPRDGTIDLDQLTADLAPAEHRTDEFGRLLAVLGPFPTLRLRTPAAWRGPVEHLRGCLVFAPEGGHPSRTWPDHLARRFAQRLADHRLVLVGATTQPPLPAATDLRNRTQLHELIGILALAAVVVTMDSAVLHVAAALGTPTVALFGGIDPAFRLRRDQRVVVLQANLPCCPCNKNESCPSSPDPFPCMAALAPADVAAALDLARSADRRIIVRLPAPSPQTPAACSAS